MTRAQKQKRRSVIMLSRGRGRFSALRGLAGYEFDRRVSDARMALCDCQHPDTTPSGFAAISEDCPIHGGDFRPITGVL